MKKIIVFTIIILAAGGLFFLPAVRVLSISGRKTPDKVFYSAAACKEGFIISYTHSVNKGRVHDYYRALPDGTLELYKTQFVSYGAGIPEPEETPGAVFTVTKDGYFIENLKRKVPRLVMAVAFILSALRSRSASSLAIAPSLKLRAEISVPSFAGSETADTS